MMYKDIDNLRYTNTSIYTLIQRQTNNNKQTLKQAD